MFERTALLIRELQEIYSTKENKKIKDFHSNVVKLGLKLIVESDIRFNQKSDLTAEWSDIGTEGASAIVKAIELAERYDLNEKIISKIQRTYLLNLAAIEYYRCGRHGIASAIFKRKDARIPQEFENSPTSRIIKLLQCFCSSKFKETWELCENNKKTIKEEILHIEEMNQDETTTTHTNVQLLLSLVCFCEAIFTIKNHFETGEKTILKSGNLWIERALHLGKDCGDTEYSLFLESFARIFYSLQKLSIWNIGDRLWSTNNYPDLFKQWVAHRISKNKPFLFPTQYEAIIMHSALTRKIELITMPTGGGKSLLAEIFILKELIVKPTDKIFFIAPSRALATEKREELQNSFGWKNSPITICQMTGDVAFDVQDALKKNSVIIVTPEKFDILLRSNFFEHTIGSCVVDEFHTIRTSYRGIKLQLAIKRFHKIYQTPILYISAIIRSSDFKALARWVYSSQPFSTDWKPTPARIGTVSLETRPLTTISFNDGTFREVQLKKIRRNAPRIAGIQIVREFLQEDQVLHFNLSWRGFKQGENRLIDLANEYIALIPNIPNDNPEALKKLTQRFARLVGPEHDIAKAFGKGIAVHYGELPHIARKIVEEGVRSRAIRLILATSTLAEGVNLPIKTIYVPKLSTRNGPLEIGLFLNVIGRAGRPFFHSEGQIVIASYEMGRIDDQTPRKKAEKYAKADYKDIEPLVTAASKTAELLEEEIELGVWKTEDIQISRNWEKTITDEDEIKKIQALLAELEGLSSNLLACLVEGLISKIDCDDIDETIFLGPETEKQRLQIKKLLKKTEEQLIFFEAVKKVGDSLIVTDWGKIIYQTGFGPDTCSRIKEHIDRFIIRYDQFKISGNDITRINSPSYLFFNHMVDTLNLPYERYKIGDGSFDNIDSWLLRGWVSGVLTQDIANENSTLNGDFLRAFTRIDGLLSTYSAWVFLSNYLIASYTRSDSSEAKSMFTLAKYALYGHYNPDIIKLLELDINRELLRDDVIVLYHNFKGLKKLFDGEYSLDYIESILRKGPVKTRATEDEVARVVMKLCQR
jgi:hypothetical protein